MEEYKQLHETEIISDSLSASDQRALIFHLLYAMDVFDYQLSLEAVAENFLKGFAIIIPKESYVFNETLEIINKRAELDEIMLPLLSNWRIERLGVITKIIIRLGIWEIIQKHAETPIIINECVELAKCFAEKDSFKFINGVLDEFTKKPDIAEIVI